MIQIEQVHGNAAIKTLEDRLVIGQVDGSLSIRNTAEVQIEQVHGELMVKRVEGDLVVEQVSGNARVRSIQGACRLDSVNGNLDLRDVESEVHVSADGNVNVRLGVMMGIDYSIEAEGNVQCRIPEDASYEAHLSSGAHAIRVRVGEDSQAIRDASYSCTLGEGDGKLMISAGGALQLICEGGWLDMGDIDYDEDFVGLSDELSEQITRQVESQLEAQLAALTGQINSQMADLTDKIKSAGLTPDETERMIEQALEASVHGTAVAQEKMRRAQEKLERQLEAAQRRQAVKAQAVKRKQAARSGRKAGWTVNLQTPDKPTQAVSEEERLMILRMLEQKKITLDQAEELLASLEGKG